MASEAMEAISAAPSRLDWSAAGLKALRCTDEEAAALTALVQFAATGAPPDAPSGAETWGGFPVCYLKQLDRALSRHSRKTETAAMSAVSAGLAYAVRSCTTSAANGGATCTSRVAAACKRVVDIAAFGIRALGPEGSSAVAFRQEVARSAGDWAKRQRSTKDPLPDDIGARRTARTALLALEIAAAQDRGVIGGVVATPWGGCACTLLSAVAEAARGAEPPGSRHHNPLPAAAGGVAASAGHDARPPSAAATGDQSDDWLGISPPPTIVAWVWRVTATNDWSWTTAPDMSDPTQAAAATALEAAATSLSSGWIQWLVASAEPTDAADAIIALRAVVQAGSPAEAAAALDGGSAADPADSLARYHPRIAAGLAEAFVGTLASVDRYRLLPRAVSALWTGRPRSAALVVGRAALALARAAAGGHQALLASSSSRGAGAESAVDSAAQSSAAVSCDSAALRSGAAEALLRGETELEVRGRVELLAGAASLLSASAQAVWALAAAAEAASGVDAGDDGDGDPVAAGALAGQAEGRTQCGMSAMTAVLRAAAEAAPPTSVAASGAGSASLLYNPRLGRGGMADDCGSNAHMGGGSGGSGGLEGARGGREGGEFADDPALGRGEQLYDGSTRTPVWRPSMASLGIRVSAAAAARAVMPSQTDRGVIAAGKGSRAVPTAASDVTGARTPEAAAGPGSAGAVAGAAVAEPGGIEVSPLPWVDPTVAVPFNPRPPEHQEDVKREWALLLAALGSVRLWHGFDAAAGAASLMGSPASLVNTDPGGTLKRPQHQSACRPPRAQDSRVGVQASGVNGDKPVESSTGSDALPTSEADGRIEKPSTSDSLMRLAERAGVLDGSGAPKCEAGSEPVIGTGQESLPHITLATTAQMIRGPPASAVGTKFERTGERRALTRKSLLEALASTSARPPEALNGAFGLHKLGLPPVWRTGEPDWALCLAQAGTVLSLQRLVCKEAAARGNWPVAFAISRCLDVSRAIASSPGDAQPALPADPTLSESGLRHALAAHPAGKLAATARATGSAAGTWGLTLEHGNGEEAAARPSAVAFADGRVLETALVPATVVKTAACLAVALESVLAEARALPDDEPLLLAMDVEWRPSGQFDSVLPASLAAARGRAGESGLHPWHPTRVSWPASTLQLATLGRSWVVDLLALHAEAVAGDGSGTALPPPWHAPSGSMARAADALAAVMVDPAIVKVGWGLSGDLAKVAASHLYLLRPLHVVEPVLDLRDALAKLARTAGVAAPAELCAAADASGLSNAVREVLGGHLSKKEQTSDWQRRELSRAQVRYAAIDALATAHLAAASIALGAQALDVAGWHSLPGPASEVAPAGAAAAKEARLGSLVSSSTLSAKDVASAAPSFAFAWRHAWPDPEPEPETDSPASAADPTAFLRECAAALCPPGKSLVSADPNASLALLWAEGIYQPVDLAQPRVARAGVSASHKPTEGGSADPGAGAATAAAGTASDAALQAPACVADRDQHHVMAALVAAGLPPTRVIDAPDTHRAEDAASSLGVPHGAIIKSLGVVVAGKPALALVPGGVRMDYKAVGAAIAAEQAARAAAALTATGSPAQAKRGKQLRTSARARMARADECVPLFGFSPGAFPPLGLKGGGARDAESVVVVMDSSVLRAGIPASSLSAAAKAALGEALPPGDSSVVFAGGGTVHHVLCLTPEELQAATGAVVATFCKARDGAPAASTGSVLAAAAAAGPAFDPDSFNPEAQWLCLLFPRPRFLVDSSLGRLVRWLRVVGIDTLERTREESVGSAMAHAASTGRLFVTRDHKLASRKGSRSLVMILQNTTGGQFEEITAHCGLTCSVDDLMSRCSKCNGRGYRVLSRDRVLARGGLGIHPKVLSSVATYFQCLSCEAVYWAGPKFDSTRAHFAGLVVH